MEVSDAFAAALVILAESCGAALSPERIKVYAGLLSDVSIKDFEHACYRCARERDVKFLPSDPTLRLPTVAELRSYLQPTDADASLLAWAAVRRAVSDIGAYESLAVDDSATAMALMTCAEDWPTFCALEDGPALAMVKGVFCAAYKQARRSLDARPPTRFAGLHEQQGHYLAGARVWIGHLLPDGRVEHERDRPALPSAPDLKRLTDGADAPITNRRKKRRG